MDKPTKPYKDFPLFPHASGRWAKKIRGKFHYFGKWEVGWEEALDNYQRVAADLHAGRTPRPDVEGLTVGDMCNLFLAAKEPLIESGELSHRTFLSYKTTSKQLIEHLGRNRPVAALAVADFGDLRTKLADGVGVETLNTTITKVRTIFKFAYETELISEPVRYGTMFNRPSVRSRRVNRAAKGTKLFTPEQIHAMLNLASPQLKAMILLGVNCGFGNTDCAKLEHDYIDGEWIEYSRPKTGVFRRCYLWPETVEALNALPKKHPTLVFVTQTGNPWVRGAIDAIGFEIRKLRKAAGITAPGLTFYGLRHTFETIGGESIDQVAVDAIMGHDRNDMPSRYRQRVKDDRIIATANFVRNWLFKGQQVSGKVSVN